MELEFIPDWSLDCPLLIFSPTTKEEAKQLYLALNDMISEDDLTLDIHTLPFITPIDNCKLTAMISQQDLGVILSNTLDGVLSKTKNHFNWKLTHQSWIFVLELLHPFTYHHHKGTYQWLDETSQIQVCFSTVHRMW